MPESLKRTLHALGWLALLPMFVLCSTQWFGFDGRRSVAAFQAVTPWVLICAAPIALAACLGRLHALAIAAVVPLITLLSLSYPIVFHDDPTALASSSPHLSIGYANMLFYNAVPEEATARLLATDADVLLMVEGSERLRAALDSIADGDDYPYRVGNTIGGAEAIQLWSRLPIISGGLVRIDDRPAIDVMIDVGGQSVRLVGVHPYPPTFNAPGWQLQLAAIGDAVADSDTPTVLIGDFNGSRWHPSFRRLLDSGWHDAHEVLGHGWSFSWPMDEGWLPPQFVRIDHALFRNGLTPTGVDDFEVPGSDHRGFRVDFGFTESALSE
ncbi:MAG: endonuclease/exonuclease/phosphatase family protein [Actinobacteria bacterium]|nr:endonuclease/exonuclease/phosphatase family protein [Actinomycetota bacterium]